MNPPVIVDQLEHKSPDELTLDVRNPRTHSAKQISQIVASIVEYGFTNPILIDREGMIIAGHARVLAARKLKLRRSPSSSWAISPRSKSALT